MCFLLRRNLGLLFVGVAAFAAVRPATAQTFTYTTLDDPAATGFNFAAGINDSGQIVGYYTNSDGVTSHGYSYTSSGGFSAIDDPLATLGSAAQGINGAGQIVGNYGGADASHGFVFTPGSGFTTIDEPAASGGNTYANGINSSGQIVGFYSDSNFGTDPGSVRHGFLDTPGTGFVTLDDPNATNGTTAFGINSNGEVVGQYQDSTGTHGFLYTAGGGFVTLDDPFAKGETIANGINDSGQIVGRYFDGTNLYGFVDNNGTFTTLSVPGAADGTSALGINSAGAIVGYSADNTLGTFNYVHGFIATPAAVPEASTTVSFSLLLALGLGGLVIAKRKKASTA